MHIIQTLYTKYALGKTNEKEKEMFYIYFLLVTIACGTCRHEDHPGSFSYISIVDRRRSYYLNEGYTIRARKDWVILSNISGNKGGEEAIHMIKCHEK